MWCLEVIKHMNKPKPKKTEEENPDQKKEESQTEPRKDQVSPS